MNMKHLESDNRKAVFQSPFRVPDGYFETFTALLMDKLPAAAPWAAQVAYQPQQSLFARFRPMLYAAVVCGSLIFGMQMYLRQVSSQIISTQATAMQPTTQEITEYVDDFCDYARISEQDIYACVSDNHYD